MAKNKKKVVKSKHSQGRPSEPLSGYLQDVFIYNEKNKKYVCRFCPKGENEIEKKNINRHISKSSTHRRCTPIEQMPFLDKQIAEIKGNIEVIRMKKENYDEQTNQKRDYLEFVAYCCKCNFSFSQITQLLQFLKTMAKDKKLNFLRSFYFNAEEISMISNELGHYLLEELKKDLSVSPYSLSVDNVTVHGTNICGLKVRYLKEFDEVIKGPGYETTVKRRKIVNKMTGISYLHGDNSAQSLLNIVKEKLFNLDPNIKNNLVGFTHDLASNLSGEYNGLGTLLKEEVSKKFFDLPDPCHALNLSLKKSLHTLPEDMLNFTTKIHTYFSYPQRNERLKNFQKEGNFDIVSLKKYVETRWLSLGESLIRLLEIWPSLCNFMSAEIDCNSGETRKKCEKFSEKLKDKAFKGRVILWTAIISILNKSNIEFQTSNLEIQKLKMIIQKCLKLFIRIVFKDPLITLKDVMELNLRDEGVKFHNFENSYDSFIQKVSVETSIDLSLLFHIPLEEQEKILFELRTFSSEILLNLLKYFGPLLSKVECFDFVEIVNFREKTNEFKEKIMSFNEMLPLFSVEEIHSLNNEINSLQECNLDWEKSLAKNSSLYLWDLIEHNYSLQTSKLSKLFCVCHSLPTSSSSLEQSFSRLKLIKNHLRSNLKEETLQSLLLISQKYQEEEISIPEEFLEVYDQKKKALNQRKSNQQNKRKLDNFQKEENEVNLENFSLKKTKNNPSSLSQFNEIGPDIFIKLDKSTSLIIEEEKVIEIEYEKPQLRKDSSEDDILFS